MKRFIVTILSFAMAAAAATSVVVGAPKGREGSVVNIDGGRYYIHTIEQGETLYSLAKVYGVTTGVIYDFNPSVKDGYRVGTSIKIPYREEPVKTLSDKKLLKTFDIHRVVKGETLYSISRRYEISVDMIMVDNPSIDPSSLAVGQNVMIRKSEKGQTSAQKSFSELDNYRQKINKLQSQDQDLGLIYHLVGENDTLESMREEFDMVEGEIEDLNNLPVGEPVAVGSLVLVNDLSADDKIRSFDKGYVAPESEQSLESRVISTSFEAVGYGEKLKISLLLPLSIRGYAMKPIVEFYNGFLLGIEELQKSGRSVEVNLFNTERNADKVVSIVESEAFQTSDLVVGPVYEEFMPIVIESAEQLNIPVVSPLAALNNSESDLLFQVAPLDSRRYDKLADLLARVEEQEFEVDPGFTVDADVVEVKESRRQRLAKQIMRLDSLTKYHYYEAIEEISDIAEEESDEEERDLSNHRVTIILGDRNDEVYREQIETMLREQNRVYDTLKYSYEHPSVITERERKLEKYVDEIAELSKDKGVQIDSKALMSLKCKESTSNLTPLIANGAEKNIFFVVASEETEVDRILSALASAYTTQAAEIHGSGRRASEVYNFCVVANPEWRKYDNIDKTIFFRDRLITLPSYLASRDSEIVRAFDCRYCERYDAFPSLYSYRGYDVASIFGAGMFGDIKYGMEGRTYSPLQTEYRFEQRDDVRGRVNTNWMRVGYNLDFSLTVE